MTNSLRFWSIFFQAKLSRWLAFWVFVSIVAIEIILLVPSALRRERELLGQIQQSTVESSALALQMLPDEATEIEVLDTLNTLYPSFALGGALYSQTGRYLGEFGESPQLVSNRAQEQPTLRVGNRYDIAWQTPVIGERRYLLILRQDASQITGEVRGFILRVAGLVVIISVVVTVATMVALGITVIVPIWKLRQDLVQAGQAVQGNAVGPSFAHYSDDRRDELADVIGAFKTMYLQVTTTIAERQTAEMKLQHLVEKQRKAQQQLVELQAELIATARQAGKAEIATNVVHNVGNVLNSVNVGSEALQRQLKGMPLDYLRRMADMVAEHQLFLADHEKMKLLPSVIEKLTHNIEQQHQACCDELTTLQTHVEHIATIVKLQQESAGYQAMLETVELTALMESALTLSFNDSIEPEIRIEKHYEQPIHGVLDKHQVLQILVNLVSNAKQAIAQLPLGEGHLSLSIESNAEQILFKIKDNGEGIAAENIEKIFGHGYTTRAEGHGFGLHGSSLNAKQMGGCLTVVSSGPGQGAEFTLMLPGRQMAAISLG